MPTRSAAIRGFRCSDRSLALPGVRLTAIKNEANLSFGQDYRDCRMSDEAGVARGFDRFVPGEDLGRSSWIDVTQQLVSSFGKSTLDADPMHIDPDWAREHTPYGGTIAFGFFTVSLLTHMLHDTLGTSPAREPADQGYFMNYGFDHLRLVSPVPVGSRV